MSIASENWTLATLLEGLTDDVLSTQTVSGVCLDSRLIESGDLYLAVGGASTHGMQFAQAAIAAGAMGVACSPEAIEAYTDIVNTLREANIPVLGIQDLDNRCALIAARFYESPDQSLTLIAVTGTDGKTSVCRFIAQALTSTGQACGYIGTLGWGLGDSLHSTELTTPDAVTLRRILARLRDEGATTVALEASSHGLAEGRLDGLSLDVAVLTNLGRDHLDYHKTIDAYRQAKAQLFAWPGLSAMVVNGCDAMGQQLLTSVSGVQQFAYFPTATSDDDASTELVRILADDVIANDNGLQFCLREGNESGVVSSPLLGRFNVDNLLACYGSLRACGVAANQARHSLSVVQPVAGRMERFGKPGATTVVVDFSHTPQALSIAIDAARVHCKGQLWVVFGCGGDRDPGKRAPMAAAAEAADHVVLTDDNPRTERSADIISDALLGFRQPAAVSVIAERAKAIEYAISQAAADDLVLVAGKGHEDYQIIGTTRYPFSDRVEVQAALERVS
ncbi:UDP-N-acetylmuramoyl-L-alanyl-D-glutamate--2,6-diaminopimelate ligase [Granulosicoccus antarcticus]|uniref:UDP-N-acetylmuramoyl-L-alanyl-D-glutamate--2,6-diaminopimelate ligase n=1 Tax=Granulosicoccus antarcticus IMCC3135 TaxID=1192854 RepID=A0A2Z2NWT1_9GAMM|nr:UDP-N-acetylmuramoyl-L-alanyl-D-glutamate--2,6-diaminopimelate ligase [Granulosicoccus antarcticus]ASJ75892.1 UDP-N-acetylmuramoyl-L-alanyl-D-glutamate--2,6-diaminopimelate ligase [Granulosicoccus antarcticus IMCC3135]